MKNTNSIQKEEIVLYCLYARKSTEDDERQAMSIDSQIKEMSQLAEKEGLTIKEIRIEKHSAKLSGQRPVFNTLIDDLRDGTFTGILTWAPDRLSRNAGDLGILVDLMDQGKLQQIKTFSQSFGNNPNEKFLLMILCSQAKLENDQKGINVKRGIRAKCEMGWRPGVAPLGYMNRAFGGVKDIIIDPERAPIIKEMFERVANNGNSGRKIKQWLDTCLTSRQGKKIHLSLVFLMLRNPFYYGEFEYPVGSGRWYKGSHEPIITKEIFDKVQKKLNIPFKKTKWGTKIFTFKNMFKCASCGSSIVGEERWRKRKVRLPVHHIYYHCSKQINYDCNEPYLTEEKLIKAFFRYINFMYMGHPQTLNITKEIKEGMNKYLKIRDEILLRQNIDPDTKLSDLRDYAYHVLHNGDAKRKRELINLFDRQLFIHDQKVTSSTEQKPE